jgi:hypothetical protein
VPNPFDQGPHELEDGERMVVGDEIRLPADRATGNQALGCQNLGMDESNISSSMMLFPGP